MTITTKQAKKLRIREGSNIEAINSLEKELMLVAYSNKKVIYGAALDDISYEDNLYRGSSTNRNNPNGETNKSDNHSISKNKNKYKHSKEKGRKSTNYQRKKRISRLIGANFENMRTFITTTIGNADFYDLFTSKYTTNYQNNLNLEDLLTKSELEKLKDITNISNCSNQADDKLNDNKKGKNLRKKIINIFYEKAITIVANIEQYFEENNKHYKTESRYKQEIKREIARRLNSLIAGSDPQSIDNAYAAFSKFVENIRNDNSLYNGSFKYITVLEFQDNGRPHFHMLCNLNYIDQSELQKKWGHGIVSISKVNSVKKAGLVIKEGESEGTKQSKIANYFTEQIIETSKDPRIENRKLLRTSNGLTKPAEVITPELKRIVAQYLHSNSIPKAWQSGLIETNGKYSINFSVSKYKLPDSALFFLIESKSGELLDKVLEIAKKNHQNIITKEIYNQAKHEVFYSDKLSTKSLSLAA